MASGKGDIDMRASRPRGTDIDLRDDVIRQLDREPNVDSSDVGVTVRDRVVTLVGSAGGPAAVVAAARCAASVPGVRGVVNHLRIATAADRADSEIAREAMAALEASCPPGLGIIPLVRDGEITLSGTVAWTIDRQDAEASVRVVRGVRRVTNRIVIVPRLLRSAAEAALGASSS